MKYRFALLLIVLAIVLAMPSQAFAQTRAWLDRAQITYGETATLNIETEQSLQTIDYRPLMAQFELAGQTVRRSYRVSNGQSRRVSLFAVGIRPRGPGVLTVPALKVGNTSTAPQRLTVLPPSVLPASGDADVFVETVVDAAQPYVQQAVGVLVRLHYAVPLMSGQLDQDPPVNASLQRVGEDLQYQRQIDGRRYNVVERRYLLVPERSGQLVLPGARFNGQTAGGFFDELFDDGRKALSAAAPNKRLQVQPIPADAPQPWLPLRDLRLRYVQAPAQGRVGEALTVEIEAIADGATAAQLPQVAMPESADAQVFADPPQSDEQFIEGRPRTILRRRIAIVPVREGALSLTGPRIEWWDAAQGVARTAMLPPLQLQVAPGADVTPAPGAEDSQQAAENAADPSGAGSSQRMRYLPWLLLVIALLATWAWWQKRRSRELGAVSASTPVATLPPPQRKLADVLKDDELSAIAHALCVEAGLDGDDLDAVIARLDDPAQVAAVERLQLARWGGGDRRATLDLLRRAFAKGAHWRKPVAKPETPLPPLYPE